MSAADRPWWATDEAAEGGPTDPLEAHRAARRGGSPDTSATPGTDRGADPDDRDAPDGDSPPDAGAGRSAEDAAPSRDGRPPDDGSWWVPATEAVTRLARDLTASALASPPRGLVDDGPPDPADASPTGGEPSRGSGSLDDSRVGAGTDEGGAGTHRSDTCGVCPICVGLRALGEARPDLVGHLSEAARQLALAVRTVIDAAVPAEGDPGASGGEPRRGDDDLHRIDLDD